MSIEILPNRNCVAPEERNVLFVRRNISLLRSEEDLLEPSFYNHWVPTGPKPLKLQKPRTGGGITLERFFPQHSLHDPNLSALATVDIRREIK